MGQLLLGLFVVLAVFAVIKAHETKWKVINFCVILGCCGLGILIGYLLGLWTGDMAHAGQISVHIALLLGCLGALDCLRRNSNRITRI